MRLWKKIGIGCLLFINALLIIILFVEPIRSQITQISGLAVAQSPIQWNNVKDAAVGDAQTSGLMGTGSYLYDPVGATWNRMRGDSTNGLWVNVKTSSLSGVYTTTSTTIVTNQVTVDTTVGGVVIKALNTSRKSIIIRNQGATDMYVGPSGVTTANGILVKANEVLTLDRNTAAIYGIVGAGSTTAGYLEE